MQGWKVIYEDEDVIVVTAPHDDEIPELIMELFKKEKRPLTWRQLREHFSGSVGEDRLRRALRQLVSKGRLVRLDPKTYAVPKPTAPWHHEP